MSDRTTLVNLALRELSTFRVDAWTDNKPEADVAADVWDQARLMTLARHGWRFAMKGARLARSATVPTTRYDYLYTLPGDYVRLEAISAYATMDPRLDDYRPMGEGIACSEDAVFIEYVYAHATFGTWPPWFVSVFVADLASLMASPLKSDSAREAMEKLANQRMAIARALDSQQNPVRAYQGGAWVQAARGARWR